MTDWLEILRKQTETCSAMRKEVPKMLANPDIVEDQVKALYMALEEQVQFVEQLARTLEDNDYDFDVVKAAEELEEYYADLAAVAAEKLKRLMG
ncbi:hypothetical protein M2281_003091 [Mesorhizobium soli]|uniref:hypothetical protein n=1 Tax=Pseudaminobacter soli (ex Li et al. 2025) TaxID=1295366 RepID=UPI002474AAB0|nr:hypothetical protein [Mesorhizobium soli]MDH6232492.1 hypothetical protein [Mesorhizobium soli]